MVRAAVVGLALATAILVGAVAGSGAHVVRSGVAGRRHGLLAGLTYVGGTTIYSVRADGSDRRRLAGGASALHGGPANGEPSFSRDGSMIAFVRGMHGQTGGGGQIWVMAADGSHQKRLTVGMSPQFQPNGKVIVFVRQLHAATNRDPLAATQLWRMNADGSDQRRLTAGAQDLQPRWSPDGGMIAFQRTTNGGGTQALPLPTASIWVIGADGSAPRELTAGAFDQNPVWSPDGSTIAFQRSTFRPGQRTGGSGTGILSAITTAIYKISLDGSSLLKLADESDSPVFSPSGSMIAFASYRDRSGQTCSEDACSYNHEIYVMRSDGSRQTRLTHSPGEDESPTWTPDGRAIVFSSSRVNYPPLTYQGLDPDLYIMPSAGGCPLRLTDSSQSVYAAAIAPNGATPSAVFRARCRNRAGFDNNGVRPEIDTDETAAARRYPYPVFYLGDVFDGIMLTAVQEFRGSDPVEGAYPSAFFDYSRCASRPGCGGEVQLELEPICKDGDLRHVFPYGPPDVITQQRGALVLIYHSVDDNQAWIYLGSLGILIRGTDSQIRRAVNLLRRFGQTRASSGPLPTPKLPASSLKLIHRIQSRYQRTHSVSSTARSLHLDASRIRTALRLYAIVRQFTATAPSHC